MTQLNQVYKCSVCGNIVEVTHASAGTLVCCNKPMVLLEEKSQDQGLEKHVPVIEKTESGIKVKVGSVEHPMQEDHYIEWIEVIDGDKVYREHLNPGDKPEVEFCVSSDDIVVREYCSLHGLWKA